MPGGRRGGRPEESKLGDGSTGRDEGAGTRGPGRAPGVGAQRAHLAGRGPKAPGARRRQRTAAELGEPAGGPAVWESDRHELATERPRKAPSAAAGEGTRGQLDAAQGAVSSGRPDPAAADQTRLRGF